MTGSMLIFCVGVNLIWEHKLKVANMLPAILVAAVWGAFMQAAVDGIVAETDCVRNEEKGC